MRSRRYFGWPLAVRRARGRRPRYAQAPRTDDARGGWMLGLGAQADEDDGDSLLGTLFVGVGSSTWLTFAAGTQLVAGRSRPTSRPTRCRSVSITGSKASGSRSKRSAGATRARSRRRTRRLRLLRSRALAHRLRLRDARHRDSVHADGAARRHVAPHGRRVGRRLLGRRARRARRALAACTSGSRSTTTSAISTCCRGSQLELLSTSTLTLANSFLDHERWVAVEREFGQGRC